jgi:thiamine-phosphate pyrophosphorylase
MSMSLPRLYSLTSDRIKMSHSKQVSFFCEAGIRLIQLRSKKLTHSELQLEASKSVEVCNQFNAKLIINDSVEITKSTDADGVHLGKDDMNLIKAREVLGDNKLIGVTIHSEDEISDITHEFADYAGLGPFRNSKTKSELNPKLSENDYSSIIHLLKPMPVFLIGGINSQDFTSIPRLGNHGLAVCSALSQDFSLDNSKIKEFISESEKHYKILAWN